MTPAGSTEPADPPHLADPLPARPLPAWLLVLTIAVIGLNLRAGFGSIPPLVDVISAELGLTSTAAALLTSVPIACMGLSAPLAQRLASRVGAESAAATMLGVLSIACLMRLFVGSAATLFASVGLAGAGMGGVSALMPALISHHLPRIRGSATGVYSTAMASGVAVAAWIAGPTAELFGGWRPALALWGVVSAVTLLCWLVLLPRLRTPSVPELPATPACRGLPWRSPTARWVTAFTTLNMLIGFSGVAWIAPTFVEHGFSPQRAAGLFALFQIIQLVAMLSLPLLTDFTRDRRPLLAVTVICTSAGLAMMVLAPVQLALPTVLAAGIGVGGAASLALVLVQDASRSKAEAGRLGAMALLVSLLAGACGPLLMGTLRDLTGGFTTGYAVLLGLAAVALVILPVFRPGRTIGDVPAGSRGTSS